MEIVGDCFGKIGCKTRTGTAECRPTYLGSDGRLLRLLGPVLQPDVT